MLSRGSASFAPRSGLEGHLWSCEGHLWASGLWRPLCSEQSVCFRAGSTLQQGGCGDTPASWTLTLLARGLFSSPAQGSPLVPPHPWETGTSLGLLGRNQLSGGVALRQSYDGRHQSPILSWDTWAPRGMKEQISGALCFSCTSSGKQG